MYGKMCNRFSFERKAKNEKLSAHREAHVYSRNIVYIFHPIGSKWALTSPLSKAFSYQKLLP